MRIDKYIWCVRLTKTRSIATKLCQTDKILLNSSPVKASKTLANGDEISIKVNPIWRKYKVLDFPKSRVGAKLLPDFIVEITADIDLEKLKEYENHQRYNKSLGLKGRPTKKDRRDISDFKD